MVASRRRLLASLGTTLSAGCLGVVPATGRPRPLQTVEVAGVSVPAGRLAVDVTVVDRRVTTASTARLRVEYVNEGSSGAAVATAPWETHASVAAVGTSDRPALLLVPPDYSASLTRRARDCWHPEEDLLHPLVVASTTVEPGATLTLAYDVWSHDEEDAAHPCIQPRRYDFEFPEDVAFGLQVRRAG